MNEQTSAGGDAGDPSEVRLEIADGIARITLNRPQKLNALNHHVGKLLYQALATCEHNTAVRAIILAGAGRSFCAGDEIGRVRAPVEQASVNRDEVQHYVRGPGRWTASVELMHRLPQPIVARLQGHAYGAGFNLALGSDFRIMASDASLSTPFLPRGIPSGTNQLQQFVGIGKAIEIVLLGEPIDAATALQLGLVTKVVPPEELDRSVDAFARRLADMATGAIGLSKNAIYRGWNADPETALWYQASAVVSGNKLHDRVEGVRAFREKRPPRFTGK